MSDSQVVKFGARDWPGKRDIWGITCTHTVSSYFDQRGCDRVAIKCAASAESSVSKVTWLTSGHIIHGKRLATWGWQLGSRTGVPPKVGGSAWD